MKTEIWVSYEWGAWRLVFRKRFVLPFTPFLGMRIVDEVEDFENVIDLPEFDLTNTSRNVMMEYYPNR